jgi:hypothetical protein
MNEWGRMAIVIESGRTRWEPERTSPSLEERMGSEPTPVEIEIYTAQNDK